MTRQVIDNTDGWQPCSDLLLVVKYQRPEEYGSLVLPLSWSEDNTLTLYEVLRVGDEVEDVLGRRVDKDDILRTAFRWPLDTGMTLHDGRAVFIIGALAHAVSEIYPAGDDDVKMPEPLRDRVVLKLQKEEEQIVEGLRIVKTGPSPSQIGVVVAVGPKATKTAVGEEVLIMSHSGTAVQVERESYLVLREREILAKMVEVEDHG